MANVFPPVRTESRIPKKVVVELHGFENAAHEITSSFSIGLELLQPSENWPGLGEPHQPPLPH